ncbi:transposase [Legionella cincinnatiensis]|uniref:IS3 element protein InsE DLP12 prophage n=1 Tax=Legionella cincinnatiensis TaxID=28085 RepID=A0A378II94_9GAMM|nr:transposase [Legionella cincinnatiensis]KTC81963.1 IS3 family transposase [Legionella cincinnatiensis]STX34743.1 IS3 element protein InsE; DLP12 prophage [Legionella cincinnatiensis]
MVRNVSKEFKIKAVELLEQSSKSLRQVARELRVAENNIYIWRKHYKARKRMITQQ